VSFMPDLYAVRLLDDSGHFFVVLLVFSSFSQYDAFSGPGEFFVYLNALI
jgi:hypothetical protein